MDSPRSIHFEQPDKRMANPIIGKNNLSFSLEISFNPKVCLFYHFHYLMKTNQNH